tara:strand:- start:13768 stop:14373 length:606 start_codon:yes stop_codon:yes gene_type:complete
MERELINQNLLKSTIRLNMIIFATSGFIYGGVSLMFVTLFSTPEPEHILNILTLFLPGYSISPMGAFIGLFWGGLIGSLSSALCYKIYSRNLAEYVTNYINSGRKIEDLEHMYVILNGGKLGLIFGFLSALSLFLSTTYLVFVEHSPGKHILLMSKWLPHYDLSVTGAFIGSLELFLIAFLFWYMVGFVYTKTINFIGGVI